MAGGFSVQGPHPTDNLPGYPARDYMAPGGTPVFAWEDLRVLRISGASGSRSAGFGGYNLYLTDRSGRNFFVTHVEKLRVKAGDVIHPGQQIANVGTYAGMATHVHVGYQGGDPVNTLGLKPEYIFTQGGAVAGSKVVELATSKSTQKLTPQQLHDVGQAILHGQLDPKDLPPGSSVHTNVLPGGAEDTIIGAIKSPWEALRWVGSNWDRVLEVAGGAVLIIIGLVLMGRSLGVTKTKIDLVEKAGAFQGAREYAAAGSPPPAKRENLRRPVAVHEATDTGERRANRRSSGYDPSTSDIPY